MPRGSLKASLTNGAYVTVTYGLWCILCFLLLRVSGLCFLRSIHVRFPNFPVWDFTCFQLFATSELS